MLSATGTERGNPADSVAQGPLEGAEGALQQALTLLQRGRLTEAQRLCRALLGREPQNGEAHHLLGTMMLRAGDASAAVRELEHAVELLPNSAPLRTNLGGALRSLGHWQAALQRHEEALTLDPSFAPALNNRSAVLLDLKRPLEALESGERALTLAPTSASAHNNCGSAYIELNQPARALGCFTRACALAPANPSYLVNRGKTLLRLERFQEALDVLMQAYRLRPDNIKTLDECGYALLGLQRPAEALGCFDAVLRQQPSDTDSLLNRSQALMAMRRYTEAIAGLEQVLDTDPTFAAAAYSLGIALREAGQPEQAVACFGRVLQLQPDFAYALGNLRYTHACACDWSEDTALSAQLITAVQEGRRVDSPLSFFSVTDEAQAQLQCARAFFGAADANQSNRLCPTEPYAHQRPRIGYFSGDFGEHPVSYLLAGVLEHHDRRQFEFCALSLRPTDPSPYGQRVAGAVGEFHDLSTLSDEAAAERIRALEIDILVDLAGETRGARPGIPRRRPAPIQVSYLGFPGTLGVPYIDYLIADDYLIPKETRRHYSEQILYLPECFQANDDRRAIPAELSRRELGLPEDALILCCFNKAHKINAPMFAVWMRLLRSIPESLLWLVGANELVRRNLRGEAERHGVLPQRLQFAEPASYPTYLARLTCADLFLDTLPFNGGTTVSDALWCAVPVISCSGEAMAARMGGSLLRAAGLSELICPDLAGYERMARELSANRERLSALRARLRTERHQLPLFDTGRFTLHLEAAYRLIHRRYQERQPPASISVPGLS